MSLALAFLGILLGFPVIALSWVILLSNAEKFGGFGYALLTIGIASVCGMFCSVATINLFLNYYHLDDRTFQKKEAGKW